MVVGTIGGVFTTLRRRVSVVVTGAASSASAVRAAAPSSTVWLCRPGLADETASTSSGATLVADPCEADLGTTIVRADGSTTMVFAKPAKHTPIDCFYVYPTVSDQSTTNADLTIDPQEIAVAEQQTSRFSQVCRVFAPMYRQVTIPALLHGDLGSAAARLTAYNDVLNAWRDYLAHDNHGRGVVFIGHSQGSDMLIRLLRNEIDPNPARRRQMVSALLLGGNVTVKKGSDVGGAFHHIVACHAANQTGCVVAYSSFDAAPPANALFGRVRSASAVLAGNAAVDPKLQVLCVNPANLAGGSGELVPYFRTKAFPGTLGAVEPADQGATPWVEFPKLYTAKCAQANGASWLQIDHVQTAADKRPFVQPRLGPAWGLHLVDVNLALGNLVDLVRHQAKSYRS